MLEYGCQLTVDQDGTIEVVSALGIARLHDSAATEPCDLETLDMFVSMQRPAQEDREITPDAIVVSRQPDGWWQPVTRYATCSGCGVIGPLTPKNMPCPHGDADGELCWGVLRYPNGRLLPIDYQPATV